MSNEKIIMQLIQLLISNESTVMASDAQNKAETPYPIGKKIIIRGYDSGVIFGTLVSVTQGVYRVSDSRRLYYWQANSGISLEDVAIHGIKPTSKVTYTVPLCDITDSRISLLIPCSDIAIKTIEEIQAFNP